jgi:hypothetical protein
MRKAMFAPSCAPICPSRTKRRPRNRGNFMRTAISLFELVIGGVFAIAVVAYVAQGVVLMAQFAL